MDAVQPVLEVSHYRKAYGDKVVVPDLSLTVMSGDVFGYVGHNGAGKTTLIRSIVGAQSIDGGSITVCGHDVATEPVACKSRIAYVPDNPDIYEFMTGMGYLNYMGDLFAVAADERAQRISAMAERLGIADALGEKISGYSHGMRQKLVLIGAFMHEPELLILDEPFVGLDPAAAHELKAMMAEAAERGAAVFFSSHVLEVVEKLCNKVAILRAGELLACGNTDEVRGTKSLEDVFMSLISEDAAAGEEEPEAAEAGVEGEPESEAAEKAAGDDAEVEPELEDEDASEPEPAPASDSDSESEGC